MNTAMVEQIANAVLYEGYILYPYRASALKNRCRMTIGGLVPASCSAALDGSEPCATLTQCLVRGDGESTLKANVRFLQPLRRRIGQLAEPLASWPAHGEPDFRPVDALPVGGQLYQTWEEAIERNVPSPDIPLGELVSSARRLGFSFPASRQINPLGGPGGPIVGVIERRQHGIAGNVELSADRVGERLFRVTMRIANDTPLNDAEASRRTEFGARMLASPHAILNVDQGEFVSMLDPPEELRSLAAECRNVGLWPVLVGEPGSRDAILSSPIILYDYPRVAPESPGDFFDGTEIDELLALRILTLTPEEKRQMGGADARAKELLDRVEVMGEGQFARLHGSTRTVRPGDRVRLRPRCRADAFDILLAGKAATVASVERDYEGTTYLAVTVDDDPGRDLGVEGKPGHRFFFRSDEVEPLPPRGEFDS
jgi:hypothetical protein